MWEFLKNFFGGKVVLEVELNPGLDPPVIISNRDLTAEGKKIRWKRNDDVHDFEFKRLNDLDQAYFNEQSIDLDRQKVKCNNRAPDNTDAFEYEIIVRWDDNDYSSTKSGSPPDGKPVIRNQ